MTYVVDAGAVAELLLSGRQGPKIAEVVEGHDLYAPHLLVPEVLSALRGWVLGGHLDPARAEGALVDFSDLNILLMDMLTLVTDAWLTRDNLSAYDAMYVALARALSCPLLTLDLRLRRAFPRDVAAVEME